MNEPTIETALHDPPWQVALGRLPPRVRRVLERSNLGSVSEVVGALRAGRLRDIRGFGAASMTTLRVILIRRGFLDLSERRRPPPGPRPVPARGRRREALQDLLVESGVDLDRPWREALYQPLPTRAKKAIDHLQLRTVREVAYALDWRRLEQLPNFGPHSLRALRQALRDLTGLPRDPLVVEGRRLTSLDDLIQAARFHPRVTAEQWGLIDQWLLQGVPLSELAVRSGKTREAVRQQVERRLGNLEKTHGPAARALLGGLLSALDDSGGLLHRADCEALCREPDLRRVALGLRIAGQARAGLLGRDFLHIGLAQDMMERLERLRAALPGRPRRAVPLEELQRLAAAEAALQLSQPALAALSEGLLKGRRKRGRTR